MKIERTKNAARNMIFGWLLNICQILVPFAMRTLMIYYMGVQYLGLNSLFSSILQVLNLAELGVGNALVFSMYRPIAENDTKKICALMNLYKRMYRIIGLAVLCAGLVLLPFLPHLISGSIPGDLNIYVLYLMYLMTTVLSYWLFAYKNALLTAHQREDVVSKVTLGTNAVQYAVQIFIIIKIHNYYAYLAVYMMTQIGTNLVTAAAASRMYPDYKAKGSLPEGERKEIFHKIRDLFTSKVGGVVLNSADTIVISAFLGLTVLAVYQNYYFIMTSIIGFLLIVFRSCTAGVGNSLVVESKKKNFRDLKTFTLLIAWLAGWCTVCLLCLYQPFMDVWVGKELELEMPAVVCLCIYFYVYEINQLLNLYKDAAGIWHEDRFRPLVTALTNLGMNLVMVQFWGIYGVILSTVLSTLFVGMPWLLHNLFTVLFRKRQLRGYLRRLVFYAAVVFSACLVTYGACSLVRLTGILLIIVRAVICVILPNLLFLAVFRILPEFDRAREIVNKMTKGKLKKVLYRIS